MSLPSLSVILPNYNHARYLPTCLQAIVSQSVAPLEVIVFDDASQDNSVEVIEDFARRYPIIRLVRNPENRGVVYNLNRGLEMARGDYITFPAADDELVPGFVEKSLRILAEHPQAGLCCAVGDWRELSSGLNWHVGVGMADAPCYLSPVQMAALEKRNKLFIAGHVVMQKREVLARFGGFPPEMRWHADWFANYVLGFQHGICYVPEPLGVANIHATSYYQSGHARKMMHEEVLRTMLEALERPEYQSAAVLLRESGALAVYGQPMLSLMWRTPKYRPYLNSVFLRKNLWRTTQLNLKRFTPAFAGNWYFKLAGFRARSGRKPA